MTPGCNPRKTASHVDQLSDNSHQRSSTTSHASQQVLGDDTTKGKAKPFQLGITSTQSGKCCSSLFQQQDRFRDVIEEAARNHVDRMRESHWVWRTRYPSFTLSSFDFAIAAVQVVRRSSLGKISASEHPHSTRCHQQYISRTEQPLHTRSHHGMLETTPTPTFS